MNDAKELAREAFDLIANIDGAGICVTDENLIAEALSAHFGVDPEEIYDNYEPSEEE